MRSKTLTNLKYIQNIITNRKWIFFTAGVAAISLFIFFGPAANLGKIDDWQFTSGQLSFSQIVEQLLQQAPFSEFWYFYLLAFGAIILFLIPVFIFFQGLAMRIRHADDQILRAKGIHKISLGLPTTIIAITLAVVLIALYRGFYPENGSVILYILGGILAVAVTSLIVLLVRGFY